MLIGKQIRSYYIEERNVDFLWMYKGALLNAGCLRFCLTEDLCSWLKVKLIYLGIIVFFFFFIFSSHIEDICF